MAVYEFALIMRVDPIYLCFLLSSSLCCFAFKHQMLENVGLNNQLEGLRCSFHSTQPKGSELLWFIETHSSFDPFRSRHNVRSAPAYSL